MKNKYISPCSYQGGKQRIAKNIVDILFSENKIDNNTQFFDLCCGAGSISIELVNRGISPKNITMLDAGPWGLFWKSIGDSTFNIDKFNAIINKIPKNPEHIREYVKELSKQPANIDTEYVFIILQAASFGAKAIWIKDNKWQNTSFRNYWKPTETSNKKSPTNPMQPMPQTILDRVKILAKDFVGVIGINSSITEFDDFPDNSIIYIDPPYKNTTAYGYNFDILDYLNKINRKVYVSEGYQMFDNAHKIPQGRCTTGINGKRKTKENEEWLNIFIPNK